MMRVLAVSDDVALTEELARELAQAGHTLEVMQHADALNAVAATGPDVVVFDLTSDGAERWGQLAQSMRASDAPHIVLAAGARTEEEVVRALKLGADDYVERPVSLKELALRIERVAGRVVQKDDGALLPPSNEVVLDPTTRVAVVRGRHVRLTPSEYRLLEQLVSQRGRLVKRQELVTSLTDSGSRVQDRGLSLYIWSLRQKLEQDPTRPKMILTRRGLGYLFSLSSEDRRSRG